MHHHCIPRLNPVCLIIMLIAHLFVQNLTKCHKLCLSVYMYQYKKCMEVIHIILLTLVSFDRKERMR